MVDIVGSLFGISSQELMNQQRLNDQNFATNVANIYQDPGARIGALIGANLGGGLARGLFNIQDPQIKAAQDFEAALAEAQQTSSNPAEAMMKLAEKLGSDPRFSRQAAMAKMKAQELQQEQQKFGLDIRNKELDLATAETKNKSALMELENNTNARDAMQGYLTAVSVAGAEPTSDGLIEAVGQYLPPEKLVPLLVNSEDKAAYRDAMIRQAEIRAVGLVEQAKARGATAQELEEIKQKNRVDLATIKGNNKLTQNNRSSAQDRTIANTMTTAMNEASIAVNNLSRLTNQGQRPQTTSLFYTMYPSGVFDSVAKSLNNSLTEDETAMYESVMTPLVRQVVTIQSGGRYKITEGAVKQEIQAIVAQSGQSHSTMLAKMAELKQTINAAAEASIASGTLNAEQEKIVKRGIEEIDKAIPWNFNDITEFVQSGGTTKFKDFLAKKKAPSSSKVDMSGLPPASSVKVGTVAKDDSGKPRFRSNGKQWVEIK